MLKILASLNTFKGLLDLLFTLMYDLAIAW